METGQGQVHKQTEIARVVAMVTMYISTILSSDPMYDPNTMNYTCTLMLACTRQPPLDPASLPR